LIVPSADLLIRHARVFTADPAQPSAEAVAIEGDRLVFVGSDADADGWRARRTIDAQGATLTPGIIDSHYHLLFGSTELGHVQLWDVESLDQLGQVIRAAAADQADDEPISGAQLRYEIMPPGRALTRHDLDAILPDRPLTIMAYDHHTAWANTKALELAGALGGAPTGPNSAIVIGADGLATGELVEPAAYCVVLRHFDAWGRTVKGLMGTTAGAPRLNPARERRWLREGLKLAARSGITSVHNMDGDAEQAAFYARMEADGELTLRVHIPYSIFPTTTLDALDEADDMAHMYTGSRLRSGRVKLFMDGVLESRTALLLDDYADQPGSRGDALYSVEHFERLAVECDRRGLQISVHAIGDAAVRRTLDGYERAQQINGVRDSRHRIEHIELIHPADLPRLARLGVVASMQPLHCPIRYPETHEVAPERIGQRRWGRSYAWQNVRGAGAPLVFGSDWPIVSPSPLLGLHAALTRQPWGADEFDQRQSLADALISYTRAGAHAEFQESVKGQVKVGMLADLALFSADLFATPEADLPRLQVVMTVCGGQIVYEA
jgi:hypothetical protein